MPQKISIEFAHNFYHAYCIRCNPVCRELGMPQTAFRSEERRVGKECAA